MLSKGRQFKELIQSKEILIQPGVYDGYSVRLVEQAGFRTAAISGAGVSESRMGWADRGVMTFEENLNNARRLADCSDLLLRADADTGYGNAMTVHFVVRAFEKAGMAALMIEDQVWPKRCGHMAGKQVVDGRDWLAKLQAVIDADTGLHVTARTDARAAVDLDEAIERARAAADLGVDALFVEAPESIVELEQIAAALPDHTLVANMVETGKTPLLTPPELHDLGFDLIVSPLTGLFSATRAMESAFAVLAERGTLRDELDQLVDFETFGDIVGLPAHEAADERYR